MADEPDKDSKTEEPTEKKIRDAFERGFVPFSREAAMLASLLGLLIITGFFLVSGVSQLNLSLRRLIDNPGGWSLENGGDVTRLFLAIAFDAGRLLIPFVVILAAAGILSSMLQNAPRIVLDRVKPQLSRLSLSGGWRRLFGAQGQTEFLKSIFKLVAVTVLGFMLLRTAQHDVMNAMLIEPTALPTPGAVDGQPTPVVAGCRRAGAGGGGYRLVPPVLASRAQDDAPGGQGRVAAGRRRPDPQGAPTLACPRPDAQADDCRGAQGNDGHRQSDPLCGGPALRARRGRRAAGGRQGAGPDRA